LVTEGHGIPLGVVVAAANQNDSTLLEETLDSRVVQPPIHEEFKQNLCLDKGYDTLAMPDRVEAKGLIPHIRTRGEERRQKKRKRGFRARRWVVERTHAWINRFDKLFIRREKKAENYLGLVHLACAVITLRSCEVFE